MKLNVAVCDDDAMAAGMITGAVRGIFEAKGVNAALSSFADAEQLEYGMRTAAFDLILLDIDLPGMDGIDFGAKLRKEKSAAEIIFVSGCENRVFDSFKVEPIGFVRKKNFIKDLTACIDLFLRKYQNRTVRTISVTRNKRILLLSLDDVVYIEGALKKQRIFVAGEREEYTLSSSMKQAEEELSPYGFIRIHSGYLVNYLFIRLIDNREVILKDGRRLPLSRGKLREARERFFELMQKSGTLNI